MNRTTLLPFEKVLLVLAYIKDRSPGSAFGTGDEGQQNLVAALCFDGDVPAAIAAFTKAAELGLIAKTEAGFSLS